MSGLTGLAPELLIKISKYLAVGDVFHYAMTCRRIYQHVIQRLEKNRQFHELYRIQHDRSPLNVPVLFRLALSPEDEKWHIRSFDVWTAHSTFATWKDWSTLKSDMADIWGPAEDYCDLTGNYYNTYEYEEFRRIMTDVLNLDNSRVEYWLDKISSGCDEPLKGMLFALLPGLRKLNFLAYGHCAIESFNLLTCYRLSNRDFDDDGHWGGSPLTFIYDSIKAIIGGDLQDNPSTIWPPGFLSLREISICTNTPYEHPRRMWYTPPSLLSYLFKLPNLKILNLNLIYERNNESKDIALDLPPGSSNVEEMSFNVSGMENIITWERFIRVPRKLRKLYIAYATAIDGDDLFKLIKKYQGQSLEYLWFDRPCRTEFASMAQSFPVLRFLGLFKAVNLLQVPPHGEGVISSMKSITYTLAKTLAGKKDTFRKVVDLRNMLPATLQVFWLSLADGIGTLEGASLSSLLARRAELLKAIADLVEDSRYCHLREVCLWELTYNANNCCTSDRPWAESVHDNWDWDAYRRIEARGIETHLHDNRGLALDEDRHIRLHNGGMYKRDVIESDPDPRGIHGAHRYYTPVD